MATDDSSKRCLWHHWVQVPQYDTHSCLYLWPERLPQEICQTCTSGKNILVKNGWEKRESNTTWTGRPQPMVNADRTAKSLSRKEGSTPAVSKPTTWRQFFPTMITSSMRKHRFIQSVKTMVFSTYKKQRILHFASLGLKPPTIANELQKEKVKCSRGSIYKFLKYYWETGLIGRKVGSERQPKVAAEIKQIVEDQMRLDDTAFEGPPQRCSAS